ncbi:hypothetical protein Tco_1025451 [Tanacetum coccineum]
MAIPCGCVGFRMVRFLEVYGKSNEVRRTGCGDMSLGGKPLGEIYSTLKVGRRFVGLATIAPHGDNRGCSTRPCVLSKFGTWQNNPPRVIMLIAPLVLGSYSFMALAELPLGV